MSNPVVTATEAAPLPSPDRRGWIARTLRGQGLAVMLIALVIIFATQNQNFFTLSNLWVILGSSAVLGLMAFPQTFLIISGGFDVSVGSVVSLSSVVVGSVAAAGVSPWLGAGIALLVSIAIGALNAVVVIILNVNPLITTLGSLSIIQGLAYVVANAQTFLISDTGFQFVGSGTWGPVPFPLVLMVIAFLVALFLQRFTRFGRSVFAIGSNLDAARLSGIRIRAVPFVLYMATAAAGGLGGIILVSQLAAASADVGMSYQLSVVTAVILGGASLAGGRGSVVGTLIAVLILGVLQNGFAIIGLSAYLQTIALGSALIVAVLLDQTARRLQRRRA
jgi:ribose transport system permease protein